MSPIKKLAGQTAIYGISSILGRFLNYLLVPLHASVFATQQYGIITEMYAYVAFLVVLLTYGMETAFFRFTIKKDAVPENVYTTAVYSLFVTTGLFIALAILFSVPIAEWLHYTNHKEYVIWFAVIVGLDAFASIPMASLRAENKATRFAFISLSNVFVNIGLNLFFLGYCMPKYQAGEMNYLIETFYNPEIGVGYVFISNLIASITKFLLLVPEILKARYNFEITLLKKMLLYSLPLLVAGLAGIVNETIDRIMLKRMLIDTLGEKETMSQLGIYGACYKISIIITLFIQAFRYAAEPFFFSQEKEKNARETYAKVMTYFVIVCSTIFLFVLLYLDFFKYFIPNPDYWEGLKVVPVLLMANICLGIYYNQSIWYKLTHKTVYGALLAIFGALITLILNYIWIPEYHYMGSAWATLICYASMMIGSYFLGHKYFPIRYNLKKVFFYLFLAWGMYYLSTILALELKVLKYALHTILMLLFLFIIFILERPKKFVI